MRTKTSAKVPPFAKLLFQRRLFNNPPFLIVACVGQGAFRRAASWNARGADYAGVVLPNDNPERFAWPMTDTMALIEWDHGPSPKLIARLALCLHRAGAVSVTAQCLFRDVSQWDEMFNEKTGKWDRLGQSIHFYRFDRLRSHHARSR